MGDSDLDAIRAQRMAEMQGGMVSCWDICTQLTGSGTFSGRAGTKMLISVLNRLIGPGMSGGLVDMDTKSQSYTHLYSNLLTGID